MRHAYTGEPCPWWCPLPLWEGWTDRARYGLKWPERLYRRPRWKHALWRLGWLVGVVCGYPARTRPTRAPEDDLG